MSLINEIIHQLGPQKQFSDFVALAQQSPQLPIQLFLSLTEAEADELMGVLTWLGSDRDIPDTPQSLMEIESFPDHLWLGCASTEVMKDRRAAALPEIEGLIHHPNPQIRHWATYLLGKLDRPEGLPLLLTLLQDPIASIQTTVLNILGHRNNPHIVDPLLQLLETSHDLQVCQMAANILGNLGDPSAIPIIIDAWKRDLINRRTCIAVLTRLGHASIPTLLAIVNDPALSDLHPSMITQLGNSGDTSAIESLLKIAQLTPSDYLREDAMLALGKLKAVEAIPIFKAHLQHSTTASAMALGYVGTLESVKLLVEAIDNDLDSALVGFGSLTESGKLEQAVYCYAIEALESRLQQHPMAATYLQHMLSSNNQVTLP